MKVNHPSIMEALNEVLTAKLTAINQYFLHSEMCANWGYNKLHARVQAESIDERKHAEQLMERVLYPEGLPNVQRLSKINIGENVHELLQADLALELEAIPRLNEAIELCREHKDNGTRLLFEEILASEEGHVDWLEEQLERVDQVGIQNYLTIQIDSEG